MTVYDETGRPQDDDRRATGVGQTGGLPGANAAPQASELAPDEAAATVLEADVAPVPEGDEDDVRSGS